MHLKEVIKMGNSKHNFGSKSDQAKAKSAARKEAQANRHETRINSQREHHDSLKGGSANNTSKK